MRTLCLLVAMGLPVVDPVFAQSGAKGGEWRTYGGDLGNTRYSPLTQINAANFKNLEVAWRFSTEALGLEQNLESTPLMVKGVLYSTAGSKRSVVALNAATGAQLWVHGEQEGVRATLAPRRLSGRGLAYWSEGAEERILYVTQGYRLIALNAKTGAVIPAFGEGGAVDLKLNDDQEIDLMSDEIGLHAAPVVAGNTIIVGAAHKAGDTPKSKTNVKGFVRGFDVRTGKRLWIFHTIPKPGEFGYNTWENDSADYTGNTGVWGQISVDEQLGLAYLPVELPTGDFYGGNRPGNGLFGESIVAVDLRTGQRKWHYQLVHHGLWDMDIPCAPILVDIPVNGRTVKALAQPTKQSFLYALDRTNGQPIWPIEERPVEQSTVPGEKTSRTQPFPTKPPAYERQGSSIDDLIDFTPELRAEAVKIASRYKMGPIFTPPVLANENGPIATIAMSGFGGGTNWPGGSYDPQTHIVYVFSQRTLVPFGIIPLDIGRSDMGFGLGKPPGTAGAPLPLFVQGLPMIKPPYGSISAIDLNKGEILWQVAHGETPDAVRNHPALKGLTIPRTGRAGVIGTLVTGTLVIAGESGMFTMPDGKRGAMLRAYNKATGAEVGAVPMPAGQTGSPMTYLLNGKQYIVVASGGGGVAAELVAYKLP